MQSSLKGIADMSYQTTLPGRLGNPDLDLRDDPRADPRMIAALGLIGLDAAPPPSPVTAASPLASPLHAASADLAACHRT